MTDRQRYDSSSYFDYANYWRPSVSLGTTLFHSRSSKKMDNLEVKHKWQIIPITSCVIIAVTLVIGIYNAVIYQNVAKSMNVVILTTTSEISTTSTTRPDTTTASGITSGSIATPAITTAAVQTTSLVAISTDIGTTKTPPTCPSMLPFGDDAGDKKSINTIETEPFSSYYLWGVKVDKGYLRLLTTRGIVQLKSENPAFLEVRVLYGGPSGAEWSAYYRNVSSRVDQDAISCLVQNPQNGHAFVLTWIKNNTENNEKMQAFQLIIASFEQSGTYVIRIYSENLPIPLKSPVEIHYNSGTLDYRTFSKAKAQDVAGQRQIFDVSKYIDKDQNLTVIEEGENCNIFNC